MTKQRAKPFDAKLHGKSRRREWSKPEPYRSNGVVLAPRRALRATPNKQRSQEDQ